jgi:hypothetical protein
MPLLDHFHPPLSTQRHWEGLQSAWANELVRRLNDGLLPPPYFAEPQVSVGGRVEVDVASFEPAGSREREAGGTATEVWAPPQPTLSAEIDLGDFDSFEVRVFHQEGGPVLKAAIELVSPRNKDRPAARRAFVSKCAAYLHEGIGLIVVDAVSTRAANLFAELLDKLSAPAAWTLPPSLYAAAARVLRSSPARLDAWTETFAVGQTLPTLPLWLDDDLSVPVDFEESYRAACGVLRIAIE